MKTNDVQDIFISYRREGGEILAMLLYERLTHAGYRVFLDIETLRSGKFNEALFEKIRSCTDVLVLLPPNALDRCIHEDDWVRLEIECAIENKKNVIPIMMRGFTWPRELPPSLVELKNYNGVTAESGETFDGAMLILKNKRLHSKPRNKGKEEKDAAFLRDFHRLQYLLEYQIGDEYDKAYELLEEMKRKYPDQPEVFLYHLQYRWNLDTWEELALRDFEFASEPEWQFAYKIASDDLKEKMDAVLQSSIDRRKRLEDEEAHRKIQERKLARAAQLKQEEEKQQKAEQEKQNRINEAKPILDKALQHYNRLLQQPITKAQYDQLYEVRDTLESVRDVFDTNEQVAKCSQRLSEITENAATAANSAGIILSYCCAFLLNCVHSSKFQEFFYYAEENSAYMRRLWNKVKWPTGVVQTCKIAQDKDICLLADGTIIYLDKTNQHKDDKLQSFENIEHLRIARDVVIGKKFDGTEVIIYEPWAISNSEHSIGTTNFIDYERSEAAWPQYDYDNYLFLTKNGKIMHKSHSYHNGWIDLNFFANDSNFRDEVFEWTNIKSLKCYGDILIGIRKDGTIVVSDRYGKGKYKSDAEEYILTKLVLWKDVDDIQIWSRKNNRVSWLIGHKKDGTVLIVDIYNKHDYIRTLEKNICCVRLIETHLFLLSTNGMLIYYNIDPKEFRRYYLGYDNNARHIIHDNVIAIADDFSGCALLNDGRIVQIKLNDLENPVIYDCEMTEEIVKQGINNLRKNEAQKLLIQREEELKKPFMLGNRKAKCEKSIRALKSILNDSSHS